MCLEKSGHHNDGGPLLTTNGSTKIFRSLSPPMVTSGTKAKRNHVIDEAIEVLSAGHRFVGARKALAVSMVSCMLFSDQLNPKWL